MPQDGACCEAQFAGELRCLFDADGALGDRLRDGLVPKDGLVPVKPELEVKTTMFPEVVVVQLGEDAQDDPLGLVSWMVPA